ncbi:MAG: hypothetical protein E6Q97_27750 [Desulfurellales bacterium]|nr:MAG: hypothetical protein E6Q97_27750 [Desulfurellales bacterium]
MSKLYSEEDYLRVVRRCERLEEENAWLRSHLGTTTDEKRAMIRERLKIYAGEARMLMCLVHRAPRMVRTSALLLAAESEGQKKVVDVGMSRIRVALERSGGSRDMIVNLPKEGYRLTQAGLDLVRALVPDAFDGAEVRHAAA